MNESKIAERKMQLHVENGIVKDKEAQLSDLRGRINKLRKVDFPTRQQGDEIYLLEREHEAVRQEVNRCYEKARRLELEIEYYEGPGSPSAGSAAEKKLEGLADEKQRWLASRKIDGKTGPEI